MRAENNVINLALAWREFSVGRKRARDVGGVSGVLRADIHDDDIAVLDLARKLVVVQRRGIGSGADNGRVGLRLRASHGMDFHHFRGNLIFPQAGAHHVHGVQLRVEGKIDGLAKKAISVGDLITRRSAMLLRRSLAFSCGTACFIQSTTSFSCG